jgi:uncharacterized membrane protein YccC
MASSTVGRIAAMLRRHGAEFRASLRMTAAGLLAFALAELFHLAQGYWSVFTAVIVTQGSLGGTLKAGLDRFLGTLGGAAFGALVALAVPPAGRFGLGLALALALAPLALLAAVKPGFRVAPVTAVIVILGASSQEAGPLVSAIDRVFEIGLGCAVGFAVSLAVLPARAHGLVRRGAARTLDLLAELAGMLLRSLAGDAGSAGARELNDRLRAAMARLDAVAREAERERRSRLTDQPDPEPLLRGLRRLRGDLVTIARIAAVPLPTAARADLGAILSRAADAVAGFLRSTGAALATRREAPSTDAIAETFDACAAATTALRRDGRIDDLPGEEAGRILALGFALEQLRRDLDDLAGRARAFMQTDTVS